MMEVKFQGITIFLEYLKGQFRQSKSDPDVSWPVWADYGFFPLTYANDKMEMDVFIGDDRGSTLAFILFLLKSEGETDLGAAALDETKILFGFKDYDAAEDFVEKQYPDFLVGQLMQTTVAEIIPILEVANQKGMKELFTLPQKNIIPSPAPEIIFPAS